MFEEPTPDRDTVHEILAHLHKRYGRPVTITEIMREARRRGYAGWHSSYRRRVNLLINERRASMDPTFIGRGYVPYGQPIR